MGGTDIRFYLSIFVRRLPYLLAIAGLVTALALAVAYLAPPVYRASARILVEPPQIPADMARPTVQTDALEQLHIIEQEITTRENLIELASRLDIYGDTRARLSDTDIVDNLRARTMLEQVPMDGRNGRGATVFSVSFMARDPELAARVVNEILAFILSKNFGLRTSKAEDTLQFFDKEVARLGAQLASIDEEVLQFRNANKNALPDSIDFHRTQQSNQQERLLLLEREEATLRVRRNNLVRMFEATGEVTVAGPVSLEQEMLRDLKRALSEQLSVFSENSRNVVSLRTRIAALQNDMQAQNQSPGTIAGPSTLDLQLSDIDERLSFIEREKASIGRYVSELEGLIDATPGNETKLNALERGRDNIRIQYNSAVAKLAEASTGEQIELRSKGGRFSVVEPAEPPEDRISPNRRRIAGAGLAVGVILGMGVIVLLELSNRSIRRPAEVAQMLQKQTLATIPYIWLSGEKRSRNGRMALGAAAAAGVAIVCAFTVQHYRLPLAVAFERAVVSLDPSRMM